MRANVQFVQFIMNKMRLHAWVAAFVVCGGLSSVSAGGCLGEFTLCPGGECTMSNTTCGRCKAGQYLCPSDLTTCVSSAAAYVSCPGMTGTHFDASLSVEERLDYLVAKVPLADQINQLRNTAPVRTGTLRHRALPVPLRGHAALACYMACLPSQSSFFSCPTMCDTGQGGTHANTPAHWWGGTGACVFRHPRVPVA